MANEIPNYNPAEHALRLSDLAMTRREYLQRAGMGMGALGLAILLGETRSAAAAMNTYTPGSSLSPLAPKRAPLPARAKHVIHIFAAGGPSHVDTWDPKPSLDKYDGKSLPGLNGVAFPSPFKFSKYGKSGLEISEVFEQLGTRHADDLCVIRSMWTDVPAHEVAARMLHTGSLQIPKPSLGSWTVYGLGTENQNLPGFISMSNSAEYRQASFLPAVFQGSNVNYTRGMPLDKILLNIRNPFTSSQEQRYQLDLARKLDALHAEKLHKEDQLESRIESFEMAFKMQTEAVDAFNINTEPQEVRELYGLNGGPIGAKMGMKAGPRAGGGDLGAKLLVARRLVERGVRFVQVEAGGWDHHSDIETNLKARAAEHDTALTALLTDLKNRNLLDSTLVIWGGEFGRTVTGNDRAAKAGRDHNGRGFSTVLAGGGVKGGMAYGATDEFGARAETNRVHIHDLHATILALLGFDHTKLTYRYNGRDFRLTDNYGNVVKEIIA